MKTIRFTANYVRLFVEDYPKTPKNRGPIARIFWAHCTAAGWE